MTCSSDKLYSFERNSFLVVALSLLHGNVNLLLRALIYFRNFPSKGIPPTPRYSFFRNLAPLPMAEFDLTVLSRRHHIRTNSVIHSLHINTLTIHNSSNRSDEGLTPEKSAFKIFMVANLRFQLS